MSVSPFRYLTDRLLFPVHCAVCGRTSESAVCPECEKYLDPVEEPCCSICSGSVPPGEKVCPACMEAPPAFRRCVSAVAYNDVSARIVKRAKYGGAYVYLEYMAEGIAQVFPRNAGLVTCVPMHPRERLLRTYDHNRLLGGLTARKAGVPFESLFVKASFRRNQASAPEDMRKQNVQGTFALKPREGLEGLTVVIVDDVITTGATLGELARLLAGRGAKVLCATYANAAYSPSDKKFLLL